MKCSDAVISAKLWFKEGIIETLHDPLAPIAPREAQLTAARSVQDAFVSAFRLTLEANEYEPDNASEKPSQGGCKGIAQLALPLLDWCRIGGSDESRAMRQALIFFGLDQWGQAWSRCYGAGAMTGLSELLGQLRDALDPAAEAAVQAAFTHLGENEENAFSFKAELQKSLLVALWHALIAEDQHAPATAIANQLGGLLLGVLKTMPNHGWVVLASVLADIQIRCLAHQLAQQGLAQEMTQALFTAVAQALSPEDRKRIMGGASQAVIAWQRATTH